MKIINIEKWYGENLVLRISNFALPDNKIIGIIGENGAGKTTFIKCVTDMIHSNDNAVDIDSFSVLPQKDEFFGRTIKQYQDVLLFSDRFNTHKFETYLKQKNLSLSDKISSLSRGQKQVLQTITTFSFEADCYLLDEPFANLDEHTKDSIMQLIIDSYQETNKQIIITSNQLSDINRIVDITYKLENQTLIKMGEDFNG